MARLRDRHGAAPDDADERVIAWRYERLGRPHAVDPPERAAELQRRIVEERDRLDRLGLPLGERLELLVEFVGTISPSHVRMALEAEPPAWLANDSDRTARRFLDLFG